MKIRKGVLYLLVGVFWVTNSFAQIDTTYIQNLSDLLSIKVSANNEIEGFDLQINGLEYELFPNTSINNSYTISYRFLTLSFGFAPKGIDFNNDSDEKGNTVSSSIGTEIRKGRIVQSFEFKKVKGYYLRNTDKFLDGWNHGDPYILYPDLNYIEYSGITLVKIKPNLSLASLTAANTRQLKSIYSFVPNLFYRYSIIDDQSVIAQGDTTQKSNNFDLSISPGFVNTFVYNEKFYLSTGFFPGIGRAVSSLSTRSFTESNKVNRNSWLFRSTLLVGIGFDNGRFYSGSQIIATIIQESANDGLPELNERRLSAEFFIGYRFHAPSFLRNSFDSFERLIPFFN